MALKISANPNPSPSTRFTKGPVTPPKNVGRKKSVAKLAMKSLSPEGYSELIFELSKLEKAELKKIYRNGQSNGITALLARAMYWGDTAELERLLSRVIGAVPQRTEISGPGGGPLVPAQIIIQPVRSLTEVKKIDAQ